MSEPFFEMLAADDPAPLAARAARRDPGPLRGAARLLARDAARRREAALQRPRERLQRQAGLGAARPEYRGDDAALGRGPRDVLAGPRRPRAHAPPGVGRVHAARGAAHGGPDPRGGRAHRGAAARPAWRGDRPARRVHQHRAEHRDQPDHRRAARRRRGALPPDRAVDDRGLHAVHAAGPARRGRAQLPGALELGTRARAQARARIPRRIW